MIDWLLLVAAQTAVPPSDVAKAEPAEVAAPAPAIPARVLASATVIDLEFVDPASSKTSRSGEMVNLRTVDDVRGTRNELLVPKGSKVVAEVIQASPARMMGKAGELTLAARWLELDGQKIPLKRFRFGASSGKDNAGTAMIATALIGLPGMFISGGNVDVAPGARANAVVIRDSALGGAEAIPTEGGQ
jgi:hypothetical protein